MKKQETQTLKETEANWGSNLVSLEHLQVDKYQSHLMQTLPRLLQVCQVRIFLWFFVGYSKVRETTTVIYKCWYQGKLPGYL